MQKIFYFKQLIYMRFLIAVMLLASSAAQAADVYLEQQTSQDGRTVTGKMTDENGEPVIGGTVVIPDTFLGTTTGVDGKYSIILPEGKNQLSFSFIGYKTQIVTVDKGEVNIQLKPDVQGLDEVVVIGYGTQVKKDLTGSVTSVGTKDFNEGLFSSPEQLINGKVAGVQIMSNSGSPSAGSTIRIRGGASLSASNDPLIVLDGVPLETGGISGNSNNFLSLINPNDIASMTILKDASSTAIYGSRASNGVILITTKKSESEKLQFSFSSLLSFQQNLEVCDILSTGQFRDLINSKGTSAQVALLGDVSTDWPDEVFKGAFGTDNNLSISGKISRSLPFRASVGYYTQDGTLDTDNAERITASIVLSPSFFDDHLKVNINLKGAINNNRFANTSAIWSAVAFNPTQPVYSGNDTYGGYYESLDNSGLPAIGANLNPVGLLKQETHESNVYRGIGNLDVDYKFHFLPGMKGHLTLGYDYAKGEGSNNIPAEAASSYTTGGSYNEYSQTAENKLLTSYLYYAKTLNSIKSTIDATAGYDYQYWQAESPLITYYNQAGTASSTTAPTDERHTLISFYGRLNYNFDSRYLLTASIRRDGTSRFSPDNRWGTFPSVALAWRASEEGFLKNNTIISDLKLRASYGVTGQQDGIGNYSYLSVYKQGNQYAQYQFGNTYYNVYRPSVYISDLKWETTKAFNYGLDFGFLDNRISGTIDYYNRKTHDLLAEVSVAAGTNFDQTATTNVGNIESNGFEFLINAIPVTGNDLTWTVGFNATYQNTKVTNLTLVDDNTSVGTYVGPVVSGRGIQILTEGHQPYMFYVYKQVFDETGKPLEGVYADLDKNGTVNEADLYRYQSPYADWILGFNTRVNYKKWNLGFALRANIGNYVYNNMKMDMGAWETVQYVASTINNLNEDYLNTGFQARQYYSDYYVENASFLKMDNISVGYDAGKILKGLNLRIGGLVQNVFTITKYSGKDPEVPNGFDSSFYPRARTYSLSVNLDF